MPSRLFLTSIAKRTQFRSGESRQVERATLKRSLQPELGDLLPQALLTREHIELVLVQSRPEESSGGVAGEPNNLCVLSPALCA